MKIQMYSIYDRVAGRYAYPACEINDGTAVRYFKKVLDSTEFDKAEFDLYGIGSFDVDNAEIELYDKPKFIVNGGSTIE